MLTTLWTNAFTSLVRCDCYLNTPQDDHNSFDDWLQGNSRPVCFFPSRTHSVSVSNLIVHTHCRNAFNKHDQLCVSIVSKCRACVFVFPLLSSPPIFISGHLTADKRRQEPRDPPVMPMCKNTHLTNCVCENEIEGSRKRGGMPPPYIRKGGPTSRPSLPYFYSVCTYACAVTREVTVTGAWHLVAASDPSRLDYRRNDQQFQNFISYFFAFPTTFRERWCRFFFLSSQQQEMNHERNKEKEEKKNWTVSRL